MELAAEYRREPGHLCKLTLTVQQDAPNYTLPEVQFDATHVAAAPSISRRSRDLQGLAIPEGGVTIQVPCAVSAAEGRVECPRSGLPDDEPLTAVAYRWAAQYRLDPASMDRDEPRLFPVSIPVHIDPGQRRTPDITAAVTPPAGAITVRSKSYRTAEDFYPAAARRQDISGTVEVACVTQEDGSMICELAPGGLPPPEVLVAPAIALAEQFEVEPVVPGQPVAGYLLRRRVAFRLE